ncbi:PAS domain-containing protein [Bradyrhizobium sp.]|jgi:PAS domain S-box-containing protein|uniref:PAS domain-containing protein n=1 Tax=Bradyrhizobium sp. TaxID=376 RepID=UPI003C27C402
MNKVESQLRGVGDPRLAEHATSALPAWLWSVDGARMLWANPVGAGVFGATNGACLAERIFSPADPQRRQVAHLAGRLPPSGAIRLERLRGFGAPPGMLATCSCSRLDFADGKSGILVAATQATGRAMPLLERLQRLVDGIEAPIAAFARDGLFVGANAAARPLLGFRSLSEAGLDQARIDALKQGRVEIPVGIGHMVLQRVGRGADVGLVALIRPVPAVEIRQNAFAWRQADAVEPAREPVAERPTSDYELPATSGEAPAAFALFDEFTEAPAEAATGEPIAVQPPELERQAASPIDPPGEEAPVNISPETAAAASEAPANEPSPYIEATADEPTSPSAAEPQLEAEILASSTMVPLSAKAPSGLDPPSPNLRRHPLRFMWQMDPEGRFSLGSDEFARLIGARTAAGFGRLWNEIATAFGLDPDGRVTAAVATRNTWSGITLYWPVDGGGRLPVELSGLPIYDRVRNFAGYRGFGVCRDLDSLTRLAALRRFELFVSPPAPRTLSADIVLGDHAGQSELAPHPPLVADQPATPTATSSSMPEALDPVAPEPSLPTDMETSVETPKNVLPFRPPGESRQPVLTAVENNAFNELARQLSERLDGDSAATPPPTPDATDAIVEQPPTPQPASTQPAWLVQPEPPARGETGRDRTLLDLLPLGVLIYRLDRLLYANPAFLARMGHGSLHALEQAGGLDALYVEPGVSTASSTSDTGTPVTISASQASPENTAPAPAAARLYTISWDGDSALALIFSGTGAEGVVAAALPNPVPAAAPPAAGHADAEELGTILDTTAEGIVIFDAEGNIHSCNRSAEALFGYDGNELAQCNLSELFAPESQCLARDYLESIKGANISSLLEHGRELLGRVRQGGLIPLSLTMGRTRPDGPNFFAVFRDLSQSKKNESELQQMRRLADRAANAKTDLLARISHEVRTPLNAIIGFAEVMISERFGALGNARYVEYMKDIRASGERVIAIISDLLDLSRVETGRLDLAFANQNLNDLVEQCVAVMQPQANRERIIIRTSLAHMLPPVVADAPALRQIALNLIGNSIHLANAGGQVIVSTALSDFGEVVLRVRDTGHGLNDREVAAALEPFRTQAPPDQTTDGAAVNLSLTKALVEANRAQFHIKTAPHSGTLIEVVFSHALAGA